MVLTKTHLAVFSLVIIAMLLGVRYYFDNGIFRIPGDTIQKINGIIDAEENQRLKNHTDYLEKTIEILVQQRNNMSRAMNLKQQILGQMECEVCTVHYNVDLMFYSIAG